MSELNKKKSDGHELTQSWLNEANEILLKKIENMPSNKLAFINDLRLIGFIDVSEDKNSLAYRKNISGTSLEFCFYLYEEYIRLQSQGSGFTFMMEGVHDLADLNMFCKLLFNKSIIELS